MGPMDRRENDAWPCIRSGSPLCLRPACWRMALALCGPWKRRRKTPTGMTHAPKMPVEVGHSRGVSGEGHAPIHSFPFPLSLSSSDAGSRPGRGERWGTEKSPKSPKTSLHRAGGTFETKPFLQGGVGTHAGGEKCDGEASKSRGSPLFPEASLLPDTARACPRRLYRGGVWNSCLPFRILLSPYDHGLPADACGACVSFTVRGGVILLTSLPPSLPPSLQGKGRKRKVQEAEDGKPAVFKWKRERRK